MCFPVQFLRTSFFTENLWLLLLVQFTSFVQKKSAQNRNEQNFKKLPCRNFIWSILEYFASYVLCNMKALKRRLILTLHSHDSNKIQMVVYIYLNDLLWKQNKYKLNHWHMDRIKTLKNKFWDRSSHSESFLLKGVLKICSKFTGEQPSRNVISIKLLYNFIEITLWHRYSPVNLVHIFRTPFSKSTSEWLLPSETMQLEDPPHLSFALRL